MHIISMMNGFFWSLLLLNIMGLSFSIKEFSLAPYSNVAVYANNSVIDINLVGEGQGYTDNYGQEGGALLCHTDNINCCRSTDTPDGMALGEWYFPNGTRVEYGFGQPLHRNRGPMVIRLNRRGSVNKFVTGKYRCEIPGADGINITRYITLTYRREYCDALHPPKNGDITYTPNRASSSAVIIVHGARFAGTIATYSCSSGYQQVGGSTQRACVGGIYWNGTQPSCQKKCNTTEITSPTNGNVYIEGITATYTCDTGYTLVGSPSRTCGADGNWTSMEPTCQIVDCGPLTTSPANGQEDTSSGTTFGSTATYTCDSGYTLIGSPSRTCGADGNWTPTAPICKIKDCGVLPPPSNGQVDISSGTTFRSTATYTCDDGFTLSGLGARTCGAAGNWTTAIPVCERVIFQLRFGPLDCIQYSSSDSLQRIGALSAELVDNVVRLCSCHFNSSFLLDPQLQCFHESPQIVTFRAQLSGGIQITAMKLVPYIQEWINSSQHFTLNGVRLSFNKSCDLVIPSFNADECPITAVTTPEPTSPSTHLPTTDQPPNESATTNIGVIAGGALAGVAVIVVITGIMIGLCFYCRRKFMIVRKEDTSHENNQHQIIEGGAEYEEINDLREQLRTRGQPHPPKGNYELTQCAAYNPIVRSNH